jgi:serine/threonine-protein kinase
MRTDLVKVHGGEKPDAPRVFTDAERTSMLAAAPAHRAESMEAGGPHQPRYEARERSGSLGRWLIAVAVLAVLTVLVTIGINMFGGETRDVAVPDVQGQPSADAIATLQNRGFSIRTQQKPDSSVPPDHVINTEPDADTSVAAGDEITLNVSTGPEQREVPDVSGLSYTDAVRRLTDAGFERFRQTTSTSLPEQTDRVLSTVPPANQTSAITNEITVVVGKGPATAIVPECVGQTAEVCQQILGASGFTKTVPVEVDSTTAAGQVVGVEPAPGQTVPQDTVIQIQVSRGNQFVMPDLTGQFWADAEPRLRALGWTGVLDKGGDVQNSGLRTNAVVRQTPAAGAGVNYGASITLNFAS